MVIDDCSIVACYDEELVFFVVEVEPVGLDCFYVTSDFNRFD